MLLNCSAGKAVTDTVTCLPVYFFKHLSLKFGALCALLELFGFLILSFFVKEEYIYRVLNFLCVCGGGRGNVCVWVGGWPVAKSCLCRGS
jgi:hypothetical protein